MNKTQESAGTTDLTRRSSSRAMTDSNKITDPLLQHGDVGASSGAVQNNPWATLVNGLYTGASNLANLLPTGTFLVFTALAPIVTDNGTCDDPIELSLTIAIMVFFALFCLLSCFTDSFQAADGDVYYGIVTLKGLWTPLLPDVLHPADKERYKLTIIDVVHAFLSLVVFAACSLMTRNIRDCLCPNLPENIVRIVPAVVGFIVSSVFVKAPSKRHGIGFPVSPASSSFASREAADQRKQGQNPQSSNAGTSSTSIGPKVE